MPTILKTKNSVTTTVVPTTLQQGELAVNITDKKLWVGNAATTPVQLLGAGVTGDVVGPASATDNAVARFDATTGKLIQNSLVTVSDTGAISAPVDASISGLTVGKGGGAVSTNTAVGASALAGNTTGINNTAIGPNTLQLNSTGNQNTAVGFQTLYPVTGTGNTGIGFQAGVSTTTGLIDAFGYRALYSNTTGTNNVAMGYQSLFSNTTASNNTAVGYQAAYSNTTGTGNVALGYQSLYTNTTANFNTALGWKALNLNSTGTENNAVGTQALLNTTTGSANNAFGVNALNANTTGSNNVAIGGAALGANTTASNNTAVGYLALEDNTTGAENTAVGRTALQNATTGSGNTVIGEGSGNAITTGGKNTIVGRFGGNSGGLDIRTASNHIVLSDGDGNPRLISDNNGNVLIGTTQYSDSFKGILLSNNGRLYAIAEGTPPITVNRLTDDGNLVIFLQAGVQEGTISVSGSTVSYNGGHLSRWSQLPDGSKDESIVKGTVMSNLDDMCVWEKDGVVAENEQLNKMKVSDVEGDTNVAGVFVNWTMDDAYGVDDMNVAMTGDMIIRIADGVVVQKGDLLMSAGDGTAKPQGDDIVRSKTIAKVTSNYVTCTYADGSYCVPCVLMAC